MGHSLFMQSGPSRARKDAGPIMSKKKEEVQFPACRRAEYLAQLRHWPGIEEQPERLRRFLMLLRAGLAAYCLERMESPQREWRRNAMVLAQVVCMEPPHLEPLNFAGSEWMLIDHLLARVQNKDGQASHPLTMSYLRSLAPRHGKQDAAENAWRPPASSSEMDLDELEAHGSNAMNVTKISAPAAEVLAQAESMGIALPDSFFDEDPRVMSDGEWIGWAKVSAENEALVIGACAQSAANQDRRSRL